MPRLLAALGQMAGQACNVNQLAGLVGLTEAGVSGDRTRFGTVLVKPGLRRVLKLARFAGPEFAAGVVLYDGSETLPMGGGLRAVPLATLWAGNGEPRTMAWTPAPPAA